MSDCVRSPAQTGYQYDVFISYRRANDWPLFIENQFYPKFKHWLQANMDRARIFLDVKSIESGDSWPDTLAHAVAHSKIMVCLWSRQYFSSEWCCCELSHMLARRKALATQSVPPRLIIPVKIHDTETVDEALASIQAFDLRDYSDPWIADRSPMAQELSREIRALADAVVSALEDIPEHNPDWASLATEEFWGIFSGHARPSEPPSLGLTV